MDQAQAVKTSRIISLRVLADGYELGRSIHSRDTRITLGRDADADVRLQDPTVSRIHVVIYKKDDGFVLHNRGSNGTAINGKRMTACRLKSSDVISIGPYEIEVEIHGGPDSAVHEHVMAAGWTADDAPTLLRSELA